MKDILTVHKSLLLKSEVFAKMDSEKMDIDDSLYRYIFTFLFYSYSYISYSQSLFHPSSFVVGDTDNVMVQYTSTDIQIKIVLIVLLSLIQKKNS